MEWFRQWRIRRLEVERERLITRVAALTAVMRHQHMSYNRDQWVDARSDLAAVEKRIDQLKERK